MTIYEVLMLVCFGVSWPISIAKSLRKKRVEGKSPLFMGVIAIGYFSGILHKFTTNFNWVTYLYATNMLMVLTDLLLYYHYLYTPAKERVT